LRSIGNSFENRLNSKNAIHSHDHSKIINNLIQTHMSQVPSHVHVLEVSPRDGLQSEASFIPTDIKLKLIEKLHQAGISEIEVTSFVSPKRVPQMADAPHVMQGLAPRGNLKVSVLTPNLQGYIQASPYHPDEVVVFGSASEVFSQKNIHCSVDESIERFAPVVAAARAQGISVRGSLSCSVACPYSGPVMPAQVGYLAQRMRSIGVQRVDLADTTGQGTPLHIQRALDAVGKHYDVAYISGHFHDTYGQALANTLAALKMGVSNFQSSVSGLGGCPYAPGATGNVATEDLVYMLHGMGVSTGIDLEQLIEAGQFIRHFLGTENASRVARAKLKQQLKM
jgi:hydroxymethylglutaryl-CoA lyase